MLLLLSGCGQRAGDTLAPVASVGGDGSVPGDAEPDSGGVGAGPSDGVEGPVGGADSTGAVAGSAEDGLPAVEAPGSGDGVALSEAVDAVGGDGAVESGAGGAGPDVGSQPSSAEATEVAADEASDDLPGPLSFEPWGYPIALGYRDFWPDRYDLDVFRDEVAVRIDSVLVRDGAVRGLVQNLSERLFARHVTVSAGDGRWVFPLTVQPTEVVPFEIEGYGGSSDPESIRFEVSAQFVPEADPRRSFFVTESPGLWADTWDQVWYLMQLYPGLMPLEGVSGDEWAQAYETIVELREPTSHSSVADELTDLVVENLRVYLTEMDHHDRVFDVHEIAAYRTVMIDDRRSRPVPVDRADTSTWLTVAFLPDYNLRFGITVGGVHDGAG